MADERPKPKYGELAPEGWRWVPPAPPEGSTTAPPSDAAGLSQGQTAPPTVPTPGYGVRDGRAGASGAYGAPSTAGSVKGPNALKPLNMVDVTVTSVLLFFGVLISASMVPALFDFSAVLSQAAAVQGYGTFAPSAAADTAGRVAGVVTILMQVAAIALSVRRLSSRKLAFPVPVLFGLVTFVVWLVVISYAFFNDPAFVSSVLTTPAP